MTAELGRAESRIDIPGTYNFRAVAPSALAPGRLYRSDALHRLSRDGRRAVGELGIRTIVDLRSSFDRHLSGRDRVHGIGATHVVIPISGYPPGADPMRMGFQEVYRTVLTRHHADIARALHALAYATGAALVHCTAGKDRTGLVIALLLETMGVDRAVVVADYALTQQNLEGEWVEALLQKARRWRFPVTEHTRMMLSASPPAVLEETLEWVDESFGGAEAYLRQAGVDDDDLDALRRAFLP